MPMMFAISLVGALAAAMTLFVGVPGGPQQHPPTATGSAHQQHTAQATKDAEMKQHGHMAMGFDQEKATHHFTLTADGGVIAVGAKDPADHATREQVRAHLREIALAFAKGDFQKPQMTHGEAPDGTADMRRLKALIAYAFEPTEGGGRVRITSTDASAVRAVHEFLRYQIREHRTGDSLDVRK